MRAIINTHQFIKAIDYYQAGKCIRATVIGAWKEPLTYVDVEFASNVILSTWWLKIKIRKRSDVILYAQVLIYLCKINVIHIQFIMIIFCFVKT